MDDYISIGTHMNMSRLLFIVDKKGKHILQELNLKKAVKRRRNGSSVFKSQEIKTMYKSLVNILNVRKMTPRLYCMLQHHMDDLLFREIKRSSHVFYIEDDTYPLTLLYFGQESWVRDQEIQEFELDAGTDLGADEASCILCFIREYEDLLKLIDTYVRSRERPRPIFKIIRRIRLKLKIISVILENAITEKFEAT
jgi:hypothetical protein